MFYATLPLGGLNAPFGARCFLTNSNLYKGDIEITES